MERSGNGEISDFAHICCEIVLRCWCSVVSTYMEQEDEIGTERGQACYCL